MRRFVVVLLGSCLFAFARAAAAQSNAPCVPPLCVHVETPPVRVETPPVDARAQAAAQAAAQAQAAQQARIQAEWSARRDAWAAWHAYYEWDASIRAQAESSATAQLEARFRYELASTPDRFTLVPPPITPPPTYPSYGSGVEVGFVPPCVGLWSGPRAPIHLGFCPDVRVRFDDTWSLTIDPFVTWLFDAPTRGDVSLGASPGVAYSFLQGSGRLWRAHAFASAGFDLWVPLDEVRANPDFFGGAHLGLGAQAFNDSHIGFGAEVRGLVRQGFGASSAEEETRASLRVGLDARLLVMGSF